MTAIHQSQFLPWVPYFFKLLKSDSFVVLDHVQYQKNGVQNRNQIKTPQGPKWLTVPVRAGLGTPINKVEVLGDKPFAKIRKTLEMNYAKGPFRNETMAALEGVLHQGPRMLHELNHGLFTSICRAIDLERPCYLSGEMGLSAAKDDLVIEIIKSLGESEYLSGKGALKYMDLSKFARAGIDVYVLDFDYAEYTQLWSKGQGFVPGLSIVDLMFNCLPECMSYISENGKVTKVN